MQSSLVVLNPDCVPTCRDSEAQKTSARREVGAILCRKHIHTYVEKQNREMPTSRDKDFQAAVDVYCTIWV